MTDIQGARIAEERGLLLSFPEHPNKMDLSTTDVELEGTLEEI